MTARPYSVDLALRWADMDAYRHVNNVQFYRFLEESRIRAFTRWFSRDEDPMVQGVLVARAEIDYLEPLDYRFEPIRLTLWITRIAGSSFDVGYRVSDPPEVGERLYAVAETTMVTFDPATGRPRRLTDRQREVLADLEGDPVPFRRRGRQP